MFVDSPLSCIIFVVGAPTRDFWSFSALSNARHSGPRSMLSSSTTSPHSLQTVSPCSVSASSRALHSGQTGVCSRDSSCSSVSARSADSVRLSSVYVRMLVSLMMGYSGLRGWENQEIPEPRFVTER